MKFNLLMAGLLLFSVSALGQPKTSKIVTPLIGDDAPSFTAKSTVGKFNFPQDFGASWKILFSHPRDYTPVCSSEIIQLATMQEEFDKMGVKIAVVSTDSINQHYSWKKALEEISYKDRPPVKINFPIIADENYAISVSYGMIHERYNRSMDVRGVFIINPENKICAIIFYPTNIGRNMDEIKRAVSALQMAGRDCVLPVNWKPGEDVMVPYSPYSSEELKANPSIEKNYYNYGGFMWFKKTN
jgi:peroxiredoxin (alkyl hydroperoxide reductase subunit C)